ncbi:DOC family protein [Xylaria cubensis]|nr:DOC family protein [Xylaria cubensis]
MSSSRGSLRFLTTTHIMRLYETHVIRAGPTPSVLLESAISSPQNHNYYGQDDVFQLAGILADKIILNHAYQNGNKRTALLAADMFLRTNGYRLHQNLRSKHKMDDDLKNAHVAIATNTWTAQELAECYRSIAKPVDCGISSSEM